MKTTTVLSLTTAALLLAAASLSQAEAATPAVLDLSLDDLGPPAAAAAPRPDPEPAEAKRDPAAVDDCFDYATHGSRGGAGGAIPGFDRRAGLGAEEQSFQRQLRGTAPDTMPAELFASCLASK